MQRVAVYGLLLLVCLMRHNLVQAEEPPIASDAKETRPLQVGATVPDVELTGVDGKPVKLSSHEKLTILWTSGDPEVAHRMVLMYGKAAKSNQWFDEVRVIIWGPSARLVAADKDIQAKLSEMKQNGITLEACVVCADSYGVSDRLRELGIEVKPMGKPLSDIIRQKDTHLITF
jgi:hypothetical protein